MEIGAAHYIKAVPLGNFRRAWEETDPESELSDDYGLGTRDSLQVPASFGIHTLLSPVLLGRTTKTFYHCKANAAKQTQGQTMRPPG